MATAITGTSAAEIAESIRMLVDTGALGAGDALPPVRELATHLGVNRNTASAAYRRLAETGLAVARGRAGTVIAAAPRSPRDGTHDPALVDLASGNPDPRFIPTAMVTSTPVLYGAPALDEGLGEYARSELFADFAHPSARIAVTNGALDAIERILAAQIGRDDLVAIEDPGLLTSIDTARIGGFRTIGMQVDEEGILPQALKAALQAGARAIVVTPRAQNPTAASFTQARVNELRAILTDSPDVLLIEDDHFALLSTQPYYSLITAEQKRFALVRSVSAALGPDAGVALVSADASTVERLRYRQGPGSIWVSHVLQRLVHAQLTAPETRTLLAEASAHYARRNEAFAAAIKAQAIDGLRARPGSGLNTWITLPAPAGEVTRRLAQAGWRVRDGADFSVQGHDNRHIRVTAHALGDNDQEQFINDLVTAITA